MTKVPPCPRLREPTGSESGSDKVPEYLYLSTRVDKFRTYTSARLNSPDKEFSIKYIRADLVEPSYGAEKIIRGNGKVQDEYILKSLHLKIKNDWFARGLKAGKISKNSSGCCCVIEDDGETISSLCGAHKALYDKKEEEATEHVRDRIKRILFKMWQRVENGQFDSRSFVGDTALSLRDTLYPPSENELEIFWKEYKTWQAIKKDLEGE